MTSAFLIKTPVFEGPLDVLLSLIEKRKLLISDISLAQVADDFLSYVKNFERFPMEQAADFVFVASTLVLVKSKSLLPALNLTPEEEGNIEELERRLKEYRRIKVLSVNVRRLFGKRISFFRAGSIALPIFSPPPEFNAGIAENAMRRLIEGFPKLTKMPEVAVRKIVSLEEMMERLTLRIRDSLLTSFRQFVGTAAERADVIVSFLALLELVKQGIVRVAQHEHFEDIRIEAGGNETSPIQSPEQP